MIVSSLQALEKEYCPPLDNALFYAITSDFDLNDSAALQELRPILDSLKESALAEEASSFDPSGSTQVQDAFYRDFYEDGDSPERATSWNGDVHSSNQNTDITSATQSLDSWNLDHRSGNGAEDERLLKVSSSEVVFDRLTVEEKEVMLAEIFPAFKLFDVSFALKKARFDFGKTVEDLLNRTFLEEAYDSSGDRILSAKGIDAFVDESGISKRRAKNKKRKKAIGTFGRQRSNSLPLTDKTPNTPTSKWESAKDDVEYITQRTDLPGQLVTSLYHRTGMSLSDTLHAICKIPLINLPLNPYVDSPEDTELKMHSQELSEDFPTLPPKCMHTLIYLTHPSTASAHELASRMRPIANTPSSTTTTSSSGALTPTYARPKDPTIAMPDLKAPRRKKAPASASARAQQPLTPSTPLTPAHAAARPTAAIDLHGLTVAEAKITTMAYLNTWWNSPSVREYAREGKVMGGELNGFKIITGVGHHSEGGVGKLGPAVGGLLVREGWRVEVGEGVLLVMGKRRA
ncbi:hypothetical protein MMC25_006846 [Agyrium rufum]|nr:hypothetical protein [Agyrium rufum]